MGEIIAFGGPALEDEDIDSMNRAQLEDYLERLRAAIDALDEEEPEDMLSEEYEDWGARHEDLEDLVDEVTDRLEELD